MNNDNPHIKIPAPTIVFADKKSLRRKSRASRVVWICTSTAVAATIAIAVIFVVQPTSTVIQLQPTEQITAQINRDTTGTTIGTTTTVIDTIHNRVTTVKPQTPTVRKKTSIPKPPPKVNEVQERVEQIRRRELPADIPVQLGSCLAQVEVPATIVKTENYNKKREINIIANTNITNFINHIIHQNRTSDNNIKQLFEKERNQDKDYEIVTLFSKK